MATLRFTVAEDDAGSRLDRALAVRAEIGSRSLAERLVQEGSVLVDGVARPKSHRLGPGSTIESRFPRPSKCPGAAGHRSRASRGRASRRRRQARRTDGAPWRGGGGTPSPRSSSPLEARGGDDPERPGIVHRLDRETSGLLVATRSERAYAGLRAFVVVRSSAGTWRWFARTRARARAGSTRRSAARAAIRRGVRSTPTKPREAVTHFEVVETTGEHALLDVSLETGRTHQIRVHLASIDLPVSGDPTSTVRGISLECQFLHAHRLRFRHPVTGGEVDVSSDLPDDLVAALERARAL